MNLKHFKPSEFRQYWHLMNSGFLVCCDSTREKSGFTMIVSPASGSIGRTSGGTWHNYIKHGDIKATDFYVSFEGKPLNRKQCLYFKDCAVDNGIKGIGLYPHWKGVAGTGFHLDSKTVLINKIGRSYDSWGGVLNSNGEQVYTSFEEALKFVK